MHRNPIWKVVWTRDANEVLTLAHIEPLTVGPLTVEVALKMDAESRRGLYIRCDIKCNGVSLYTSETSPGNVTNGVVRVTRIIQKVQPQVTRIIEEGLTQAHKTIGKRVIEAQEALRTLLDIRDRMDYVALNYNGRTARLSRDMAELVLLVRNERAPRPTRLEAISPSVAAAFGERGELLGRIGYNPTDPRNKRGRPDSVGYYGFYEVKQQPRPEVGHEQG